MMTTPSGWRAVPVRLTSEQIAAMQAIPIGRDLIGSKEFFDQHHAAMLAAAPSPPSAEPLQSEQPVTQDVFRIAELIGEIFTHGNFKAETYNERELERLLRKQGFYPTGPQEATPAQDMVCPKCMEPWAMNYPHDCQQPSPPPSDDKPILLPRPINGWCVSFQGKVIAAFVAEEDARKYFKSGNGDSLGPTEVQQPSDALRAALEASITAIDDWLNTSAPEHCDAGRVDAAKCRIHNYGGTLSYIAIIQQQNRAALLAAPSAATCARCDQIVADLARLAAPSAGSAGQADGCRIALSEIIDIWDDGKLPHEQQTYIPEALTNAIESARVELESRPEAQPVEAQELYARDCAMRGCQLLARFDAVREAILSFPILHGRDNALLNELVAHVVKALANTPPAQAVDQQARRLIAEFLAAAELADQDDTDDSEVIARRNRDFFAAAQEVVPALRSLAHPETQDKEPQT